MSLNVAAEVARLEGMTVGQLRLEYESVVVEACRSFNKRYLVRRIAWHLQAKAEGGLSERALRRAEKLGDESFLRTREPKPTSYFSIPRKHGPCRRTISRAARKTLPGLAAP